jgi:hypothetical protein
VTYYNSEPAGRAYAFPAGFYLTGFGFAAQTKTLLYFAIISVSPLDRILTFS